MFARSRSSASGLLLLVMLLLPGGCGSGPAATSTVVSFAGPTMGTRYSVKAVVDDPGRSEVLQRLVDARLVEINELMSTYDPDSELSRFNQSEGADWFEVSEETAEVVDYALQISQATNGKFDPTVGPAVNLWGFGPDGRRLDQPTDEQVTAAMEKVGYRAVSLRTDPPALRKSRADVYLDLSAIAKGYGVDAVSELLASEGVESSMVEIGGEVVCRGVKPNGESWRIGVEKPDETGSTLQMVVELSDLAIATSGDYRNFFEDHGHRFSHTIDPATGRPVLHNLATVSVVAENCMRADSVATALLVMGPEEGYNWASENHVAAMFIEREPDGFRERLTPGWESPIESQSSP